MKNPILIIALLATLMCMSGCVLGDDPERNAQATERTTNASIAANQNAAQISQAQQADDEARRAQERLQALQAQQAIVQGQAAVAQAQSQTDIAASNNEAMIKVADQIKEASKPDYTILIVVLLGFFGLAGLVIWKLFAANVQLAQAVAAATPAQRERPMLPEPHYIQIPTAVQLKAQHFGGVAQWNGERWVIINPDNGRVLATQRLKQLTG